ncbi:MAG: ABC transporter substrate-binding protein, partial [Alkalispirochaeta sp.]
MKYHHRNVLVLALLIGTLLSLSAQSTDPHSPAIDYAASLDIEVDDHGVTVTVSNAWQGAHPLSYAVVPEGSPRPAVEDLAAVVELPVRRIASLATPALAHLADLDGLDRVVAVDEVNYVYNREVLQAAEAGDIVDVGSGAELNVEQLIASQPDVVIASAYGADDPTVGRIQAAGIPVIVYADWREHDPLARAEWIKLFGVLLERSGRAEEIFSRRARRYRELA